jgi:EamA domain-containing membrane protein RarD
MAWVDIIGYAGSVLIAVSITMNNIWKLRWINLFGAGTFAVYGLIVKAYPVFVLNSFITPW